MSIYTLYLGDDSIPIALNNSYILVTYNFLLQWRPHLRDPNLYNWLSFEYFEVG